MRTILLLFLTVALSASSPAQSELTLTCPTTQLSWLNGGTLMSVACKMYCYEGDSIAVTRSYYKYCPVGDPPCLHWHAPITEVTYTAPGGFKFVSQRELIRLPCSGEEGWEGLKKMIRDDEEFGPAAYGR